MSGSSTPAPEQSFLPIGRAGQVALATVLVAVIAAVYLASGSALYSPPAAGPYVGTPIIAFMLGTPVLTNGTGGQVATYPVVVAASGLIAVDIQFCYTGADLRPVSQSYDATVHDSNHDAVAMFDSARASACISPATGLSSSMLTVGGWVTGSGAQVVVGDSVSIDRPATATTFDVSNWGPGQDGSSMFGYSV